MQSLRAVAVVIVLGAIVVSLVGCSGSSSSAPPGPPPAGHVTLQGHITAADNAATVFPQAAVTLLPSGATGNSDSSGNFIFTGLQSMPQSVQVNPAYQPSYMAAEILLPPTAQTSLTLNIALLPRSAGTVTSIGLNPQAQQVEIGGKLQFSASIVTSAGTSGLQPTWFAVGTAGTIDARGVFTCTHVGKSTIFAFSGGMFTSTTLTVVSKRGPAILDVLVDPLQLPPGGGPIVITSPLADSDGVALAEALIFFSDGTFVRRPLALVAGVIDNGTFRATYQVPANSNIPDASGTQAPQHYQLRVRAVDGDGMVSLSKLVGFTVLSLPTPPPPPS